MEISEQSDNTEPDWGPFSKAPDGRLTYTGEDGRTVTLTDSEWADIFIKDLVSRLPAGREPDFKRIDEDYISVSDLNGNSIDCFTPSEFVAFYVGGHAGEFDYLVPKHE